jgi:hypothetical protein
MVTLSTGLGCSGEEPQSNEDNELNGEVRESMAANGCLAEWDKSNAFNFSSTDELVPGRCGKIIYSPDRMSGLLFRPGPTENFKLLQKKAGKWYYVNQPSSGPQGFAQQMQAFSTAGLKIMTNKVSELEQDLFLAARNTRDAAIIAKMVEIFKQDPYQANNKNYLAWKLSIPLPQEYSCGYKEPTARWSLKLKNDRSLLLVNDPVNEGCRKIYFSFANEKGQFVLKEKDATDFDENPDCLVAYTDYNFNNNKPSYQLNERNSRVFYFNCNERDDTNGWHDRFKSLRFSPHWILKVCLGLDGQRNGVNCAKIKGGTIPDLSKTPAANIVQADEGVAKSADGSYYILAGSGEQSISFFAYDAKVGQ